MKTTKYRICWRSLIHEGIGGKSDPVYNYDTAVKLINHYNNMENSITHYIEPVEVEEKTK